MTAGLTSDKHRQEWLWQGRQWLACMITGNDIRKQKPEGPRKPREGLRCEINKREFRSQCYRDDDSQSDGPQDQSVLGPLSFFLQAQMISVTDPVRRRDRSLEHAFHLSSCHLPKLGSILTGTCACGLLTCHTPLSLDRTL